MSFITELAKELQILISNYSPKFIILCGDFNWHTLLRQNFSLEFCASVPATELRELYIEKCLKEKLIYNTREYTLIVSRNGDIYSCGKNGRGQLGHGDKKDRSRFEKIRGVNGRMSQIVAMEDHAFIRLVDGTILACGNNIEGHGT